ncbi:glucose-1-phosphate cytidylyltransferase [Candidatus Woesearchaeota archaeon]|nr:glucose-1-phosphate cytidylyltransferase [Candidatus Woesearchaeota archaeon]
MKTVILAGGVGMRMKEYTGQIPKPLVHIGDRPIIWHIMKLYSYYGFNEFIVCLGYRGDKIKDYFVNYHELKDDFTLQLSNENKIIPHSQDVEDWKITFADTGENTNTGGRIKKIEKYIDGDDFFCTYGDGVSNVDLNALLEFHRRKGKIATLTAINPISQYGILDIAEDDVINSFREKPRLSQWINGGFFVFNRNIFSHLHDGDVLEKDTFGRLTEQREIAAYRFKGFWECMDTFKDAEQLNRMWNENIAPWRVWK